MIIPADSLVFSYRVISQITIGIDAISEYMQFGVPNGKPVVTRPGNGSMFYALLCVNSIEARDRE